MFESFKDWVPTIHKEGYVFILCFVLATFVLFAMSNTFGWIGVILTIWCIYFFRDPERITPVAKGLVISPADGLIQRITRAAPPKELDMAEKEMTRISIFLNVFDVHVNRIAVDGVIEKAHYHPGKFLNASLDKASEDNERQSLLIKTPDNQNVALVQIAGLIARRIVCNAKENEQVLAGRRFGIIRFGSRVDIYLPDTAKILVKEGQTAIGGETIVAMLSGTNEKEEITWESR
ncbi:MAG: phosphatidylserine decarboxylase [Candidatus Midichloria mitochondrii]|uniref:Phosphatidylserine decarboxylase proenzyme n=1 Tax=Midichloria mitochondrii (strain IricVA) TaxID=696127 RepID=F7XVJ3_MIDMI|nr:phosphatidylserine decarboxylase [Candidatus Midichloria mitochondrii]AEI88692.1 phosphatidylserine decarboxylase [Candidatus Midichloria mitochondrii IricVA]MDJ1256642.1 phosphatidylserine decarboxylase [Candidatus Midichloria mitochondrii]MDJ1288368.1 phosphatidylserine decarboxylase [Candidatus Midichloria mitochondrii]MDJ1299202.1 phosphatidylserine decarboxylase [Candidatus Midichloria mitochondrii]MDJ1313331.1 phosphatidylserine decarboxylase [Candidatus Midichloria mitochondrii]